MMSILRGNATVQFFEIASAVKGYGKRMVQAILKSIPDDWVAAVAMDNSGSSGIKLSRNAVTFNFSDRETVVPRPGRINSSDLSILVQKIEVMKSLGATQNKGAVSGRI
jgi:hypothetical protein